MKKFVAVILAAGYGKRLQSDIPKVLNLVQGKPMISMVVNSAIDAGADRIIVVVGYRDEEVIAALKDRPVEFAFQKYPRGTGDALKNVEAILKNENRPIIVLCGDVPLITPKTIRELVEVHIESKAEATILTADIEDPTGYGRIICDNNSFNEIIEESDCSLEQKAIKYVNAGTYCFDSKYLWSYLARLNPNNSSNEYYLTDIFKILRLNGKKISIYKTMYPQEIQSVNRPEDLIKVNKMIRENKHM